ncbi:hypothetical protein CEXT_707581 [Caerostris extrusa]|uniref:Uncharacterized protein n=1 Tax=Caerostris extrusa TaxID=172846 RepID=A0AAV4YAJ3_CAEEX|nr:hypothetical protein CEXT_707581 [Caerostris extrusa]
MPINHHGNTHNSRISDSCNFRYFSTRLNLTPVKASQSSQFGAPSNNSFPLEWQQLVVSPPAPRSCYRNVTRRPGIPDSTRVSRDLLANCLTFSGQERAMEVLIALNLGRQLGKEWLLMDASRWPEELISAPRSGRGEVPRVFFNSSLDFPRVLPGLAISTAGHFYRNRSLVKGVLNGTREKCFISGGLKLHGSEIRRHEGGSSRWPEELISAPPEMGGREVPKGIFNSSLYLPRVLPGLIISTVGHFYRNRSLVKGVLNGTRDKCFISGSLKFTGAR